MVKFLKKSSLALLIPFILYLIFFYPLLSANKFIWDSDVEIKHYPAREYFYRVIRNEKRFPLWTEKVLFGYPIYVDMENAYLNPVNILSIVIWGPVVSYKIVHFLSMMLGSYALFLLLKRKGLGLIPYAASTLIYFYSFFHLNHLIHLNLIAISLLFPLNILLADYFIETLKKKYLYLQALLLGYGLLWGHPQTTLLVLLGILFYIFILGNDVKFKDKIVYLFSIVIMSVGIALPQLVPSAKAYLNSYRGDLNSISSVQGSLTPELSLSYVFPYLYGTFPYYYGEDVAEEYSYTELYNYVGIVALSLAISYMLLGKKDRLFYFCYSLIILFLVLAYLKYIPIFDFSKLPIISSFRYWTRSIFLFSFALSILSAHALGRVIQFNKSEIKKSLLLLLCPILYFLILSINGSSDPILQNVHNSIINYRFDLLLKRDIFLWVLLPTLTVILFFIKTKAANKNRFAFFLGLAILLVLLVDYRYFAKDVLDFRIKKWNWESGLTFPLYYNNTRVIDENMLVRGMKPLLRSVYTPYGYSQFIDRNYWLFFEKYHLGKSPRTSYTNDYLRPDLDAAKLKEFGITYIRTGKMEYILRDTTKSSFFKEELPSTFVLNNEGHFIAKVENNSDVLFTTIKNDSNWEIKVNDNKANPEVWENIFIKLNVPAGENILEFKYVPRDLYLGVILGVPTLLLSFLVVRKIRFEPSD